MAMALAMAATTTLLQHPSHHHPLLPRDFTNYSIPPHCHLCHRKISADAYACCQEECNSYYCHKVCAEAPPQIDLHPLHPIHPLTLIHGNSTFRCDACGEGFEVNGSSFRCEECDFDVDIGCALSCISDKGDPTQREKSPPEQITLLHHSHPLISFSTRHDFVWDGACLVCQEHVQGDGYMCLRRQCEFLIHKGCIPVLYYADGTKAPRVFHDHRLETFTGEEDTGSSRCAKCESDDMSGEFIGCASCEVFIHRDCIQVPEIFLYPHHPNHILVLFINCPGNNKPRCDSCSSFLTGELCYRCTSCEFFVHVGCALEVIAYCEEGLDVAINLSWHEHKLFLCHMTKYCLDYCSYCEDESVGANYACKTKGCGFLLHEGCIQIETTITHPHHPDHPLTLRDERSTWRRCNACCDPIHRLDFCCKLCEFYLHVKCAARVPTRKHYLHEHVLLTLDEVPSLECNRCGSSTDSPFLRCVPCDFNLHEKCTELPQVVKHNTHVHPLTLRESYVEDDSGEYYCDLCGERRDGRLGVYVCEICKVTWAFQIECVLPELQKVYSKKSQTTVIERLVEQIAEKNKEIKEAKEKVEKMERELDELMKRHSKLVLQEEKE